MPGGPMPYFQLYEQKVHDGKQVGVRTPEGAWYPFNDGPVAKYVFIVCHSEQGEESLAF